MHALSRRTARRHGSILPMLAVTVTALFGFVALAVDLGMMMIARTECQNAADTAALTGARNLDGKVPNGMTADAYDNNAPAALTAAQAVLTNNVFLNTNFTAARVTKVQVGVYDYLAAAQSFSPMYDAGRTNLTPRYGSGSKPTGKAWSCCRVEVDGTQPSYFGRILGMSTMPMSANAVAVHRPRDIALVLDFSGSMRFSSETHWPVSGTVSGSLNPDPLVPQFGHYGRYTDTAIYNTDGTGTRWNPIRRTVPYTHPSGELSAPNNFTMRGRNGPPMVDGFRFMPTATPATPVTTVVDSSLRNAFNRWNGGVPDPANPNANLPPESSPGTPNSYIAPVYDFSNYDAFDTDGSHGPTPAPDNFGTQTDLPGILYVGDKYPRKQGAATGASWSATNTNGAAVNAAELLGWCPRFTGTWGTTFPGNPPSRAALPKNAVAYATDWSNFRDLTWERYGYDLDVAHYVANRNGGLGAAGWDPLYDAGLTKDTNADTPNPPTASTYTPQLKPAADRYKGYSMGPGYWGKTFFIWPPDPRYNPSASPSNPDPNNPVQDTSGRAIHDWRRRFFRQGNGTAFSPTGDPATLDNDSSQAGLQPSLDGTLLNHATNTANVGAHTLNQSVRYSTNHSAVLAWLKTGPQVLPPNLRAGRIVYYTSIPNDVNFTAGSTAAADMDKRFWREYIDFVIGDGSFTGAYDPRSNMAGVEGTRWPEGATNPAGALLTARFDPDGGNPYPVQDQPYTNYTFNPNRPRHHFWFGPASMMAFLQNKSVGSKNWNAGTLNEAQSWQLKAGIQSGIEDIRNNHPNDQAGLAYFAHAHFKTTRVAMGQDWVSLKNALFYPQNLLALIKAGDTTTERRPYNDGFGNTLNGQLPNGNGATDPNTGLILAYNLLSSSTTPNPDLTGRRGAAKTVIFETDGVPNSHQVFNYIPDGPNSYYSHSGNGAFIANGDSFVIQEAIDVTTRIVSPVNNTAGSPSGFSLPNTPARVYAIAFGDLFDPSIIPAPNFQDDALTFLLNVQKAGNTSAATDSALPPYQIITGPYETRIDNLKSALERIFQSGVQVTLIE